MSGLSPRAMARKLKGLLAKAEERSDARALLRETEAIAAAPGPAPTEQLPPRPPLAPQGERDTAYGPVTDLLTQVFGTRFVAMPILEEAFTRYLVEHKPKTRVSIERPGFLRFTPRAPFPAGPRQSSREEHAVFRDAPPADGVYAIWYDDRPNTLLVRIDNQGFDLGRFLCGVALERDVEISSLARRSFLGSKGVIRSGRGPASRKVFRWRWHTFEVWGDGKKNPWDVNAVYRTPEVVELDEGSEADLKAVLMALKRALVFQETTRPSQIGMEVEEDTVRFTSKKLRDKPLGELRREDEVFEPDGRENA